MRTVWFRSKVDWWLWLILLATPVVSLAGALTGPPSERWVGLAAVGVIVATYGLLVFPMRYGISETELVVRYGVMRKRIKLADITSVVPSRSTLSSPALSLDRMRITFGQGFFKKILISPEAKQQFLVELALRARLVRSGDGLARI